MQTILVAQYFEMCLEGFLCKLCFFGNFRIFYRKTINCM